MSWSSFAFDSLTTDPSILLKLTPSEVKTRITNRYNELIVENYKWERRLEAINFTLAIVGLIPGPIGVIADLANATIYYIEGDVESAAVSVAATVIPIAGGVLISKLRKTAIAANKTVAVGVGCAIDANKTTGNIAEIGEKNLTNKAANAPKEVRVIIKTADDGPDPLDVWNNEGGASNTGPQISSKCAPSNIGVPDNANPRLFSYSNEPEFVGNVFHVGHAGRAWATEIPPGDWAFKSGFYNTFDRITHTGQIARFNSVIEITGPARDAFVRVRAFGPARGWKRLGGQFFTTKPGDFCLSTGEILEPTIGQWLRFGTDVFVYYSVDGAVIVGGAFAIYVTIDQLIGG